MTMAGQDPNEPVTRGMLDEAVSALLNGMDNLYQRFRNEIAPLTKDVSSIQTDVTFIKRDIHDIKADLSDTPSRREFNKLKDKVEDHIQLPH